MTCSKDHAASNQAAGPSNATGREKEERQKNLAFRRSGRMVRTPPPRSQEADTVIATEKGSQETAHTKDQRNEYQEETPTTPPTPLLKTKDVNAGETTGDLIKTCIRIITKMKAATGRQKNISNDIKIGLAELEEAIDAISHAQNIEKPSEHIRSKTVTTNEHPIGTGTPGQAGSSNKRTAKSPLENLEKRIREVSPTNDWRTQASRKDRRIQNKATRETIENPTPEVTATPTRNFRSRLGSKNKRRRGRIKPEALLIKPGEGKRYADVVREIRTKVNPEDAEAEVKAIRQTKSGFVLLELGAKTKNKDEFREALRGALGEGPTVLSLGGRATVEIRDMDCYTEAAEVEDALKRDFPGMELSKLSIYSSSREQKVAVLEIDERSAHRLIDRGKIKIGWVLCRVRERAMVTRCYKCFGYGHVARNCSGPDRSKLCYKCQEPGHIAKMCSQKERCMVCLDNGINEAKAAHIPGSGKCELYREALQAAKLRLC